MKKSVALSIAALAGGCLLAAVCGCTVPRSAHTWAEEWSNGVEKNNAPSHWHACLDENCNQRKDYGYCHLELAETVEPSTCQKKGTGEYRCTECGNTVTKELPLADHTYEIVSRTMQETCSFNGYGTYRCTECGNSYDGAIPATGEHNLDSGWSSDETGHFHACLNTKKEQNGTLTPCPYRDEVILHTAGDPVTVPATKTTDGSVTTSCTVCGYVMEKKILAALDAPVTFGVTLTPDWGGGQTVVAPAGQVTACTLYFGVGANSTERKYNVIFEEAKNSAGEDVSTESWEWDAKTGSGVKAYLYDDSGAGSYKDLDGLSSSECARFLNGKLWFVRPPETGECTIVFRYINTVEGKEVVRAEKRLLVTVATDSAASARSATLDLYVEEKRR